MIPNYRDLIKDHYIITKQKNPLYSVRSMAKSLGVAPSMLSSVLSGERDLSTDKAMQVGKRMQLGPSEFEYFMAIFHFNKAKTVELKSHYFEIIQGLSFKSDVFDISLDTFQLLSEWYYFAIIELLETSPDSTAPREIAKRLGLDSMLVEQALKKLARLKLIESCDESGTWVKSKGRMRIDCNDKDQALRSFHKQTLQLAASSLQTQTPQEKFVGSETFALDPEQLEDVKKVINDCFDRILDIANQGKKKEVYHLGIQCFRLTKIEEPKRSH